MKLNHKQARRVVNFLLSNHLDEQLSEIFELATSLELPLGISEFGDEQSWNKAFNTLNEMIKNANIGDAFQNYIQEINKTKDNKSHQ